MLPAYLSDQKEPVHILEALEMLLLLNDDLSQRAPSVAIKPPNQKRCCLQISTRAPLDRKFPPMLCGPSQSFTKVLDGYGH